MTVIFCSISGFYDLLGRKNSIMNEQTDNVTTRQIAQVVGCSHVSVSRALKGDPSVSAGLKERILKVAKEMDYRANPMVSSLLAMKRRKDNKEVFRANIAWLNTHTSKTFWHEREYTRAYYEAARARAELLGFSLNEIWQRESGMNARRLKQILDARSIFGVIVAGEMDENEDWDSFFAETSAVFLREQQGKFSQWSCSDAHSWNNTRIALEEIRKHGYKRIGIAIPDNPHKKKFKYFNAYSTYMGCLSVFDPDTKPEAFFYKSGTIDLSALRNYISMHKIEVLICMDIAVLDAVREAGFKVPEELSIVHLHITGDVQDWAGINPLPEQIGASVVDLLSAQLVQNQRGIPKHPKTIYTLGKWQDGWTLAHQI